MKWLLLLSTFFVSSLASAQEFKPDIDKIIGKSRFRDLLKRELAENNNMILHPGRQLRPGVYPLAQDQMPCIVPDTKELAIMPNAGLDLPEVNAGKIPNAISKTPSLMGAVPSQK